MHADEVCKEIAERGYCVVEDLLDPHQAAQLDTLARRLMDPQAGYVNLEGALLHIPELAALCTHPLIMEVSAHFLGAPFYLANNVCMKWCQPGTVAGRWHADWPLSQVPQPYPSWPLLLQTMWMLTDFSDTNGATQAVPGSHKWGRPADADKIRDEVTLQGRSGDLLLWHGALWHRSGANTSTDQQRMGANIAYIPQYIHRPPHQWPLVPRKQYDRFSAELQQLLERSVE